MFDEHNIKVPPDIVREEVEVEVRLHAHVHAAHYTVQGDVGVDWDHLGREPAKSIVKLDVKYRNIPDSLFLTVGVPLGAGGGGYPGHLLLAGL